MKVDVSVIVITYGHEKYIEQTLLGILNQKSSYKIQVIIANDNSPDNTDKIIKSIINNHPNGSWINYINRKKNIGMTPNFIDAFQYCTGKFVALCEGDDYWIDENKIQFQVDFLENNKDFSVCFHTIYELINGKLKLSQVEYSKNDGIYTLEDMALGSMISTLSVVFRNDNYTLLPEWFSTCSLSDYALHMINGQYGKYKGFNKPMAVYRHHDGGVFSMKPLEQKVAAIEQTVDILQKYFPEPIENILKMQKQNLYEHLIRLYYFEKETELAEKYLKCAIDNNNEFASKAALEILPIIIKNIYKSKRYRMGDRIAFMLRFINLKGIRND